MGKNKSNKVRSKKKKSKRKNTLKLLRKKCRKKKLIYDTLLKKCRYKKRSHLYYLNSKKYSIVEGNYSYVDPEETDEYEISYSTLNWDYRYNKRTGVVEIRTFGYLNPGMYIKKKISKRKLVLLLKKLLKDGYSEGQSDYVPRGSFRSKFSTRLQRKTIIVNDKKIKYYSSKDIMSTKDKNDIKRGIDYLFK